MHLVTRVKTEEMRSMIGITDQPVHLDTEPDFWAEEILLNDPGIKKEEILI